MLTQPFLTELDSRAAVKGSVDPLGFQAVWTHFGRFVVGNLTTVTSSAMDFTVLLVGYYLAEAAAEIEGTSEVETFLKWEQLAAYARLHVLKQTSFRGTTRAQKYLDGKGVTLSAEPGHQILGSQKTYGIFGLYSNPARASGLIEGDRVRLAPAGREIVEKLLLPKLASTCGKDARVLVDRLQKASTTLYVEGRDQELVRSVGKLLDAHKEAAVREPYREYLLFGGPADTTGGRQRALAYAYCDTFGDPAYRLGPAQLRGLASRAARTGRTDVANWLEAIRTCESALAPLASVFGFALHRHDQSVEAVAAEVAKRWGSQVPSVDAEGLARLQAEVCVGSRSESAGARLVVAGQTLRAGHYAETLRLLIQQNAWVMETRGGAPWIEERKGKLRVRLRYDDGPLPAGEELPELWRHAYFLDSVRSIGEALGLR